MDDVSAVRDLSVSGVFLKTEKPKRDGETARVEFLVQEGQIRTEAIVRRFEKFGGLGLKFVAINEEDRPRLAALLMRLRSYRKERREESSRVSELVQVY